VGGEFLGQYDHVISVELGEIVLEDIVGVGHDDEAVLADGDLVIPDEGGRGDDLIEEMKFLLVVDIEDDE
jgi:hypothetical protein